MRHMLNTLFVTAEDLYLSLENENIVVWRKEEKVKNIPLLNLENILYFGYPGASPALLGACCQRHIGFCFLTPQGRFLARVAGQSSGNVLLRKEQYRLSDEADACMQVAHNMIAAKIYNARTTLMRGLRDHPLSVDRELFEQTIRDMAAYAKNAAKAKDMEELRGVEGSAAKAYFSCVDGLILQDKKHFTFEGRSRRPPLDPVNAMLSFVYTILAHDCAAALEAVGLDAYVGFIHRCRPGRESLALDMLEELRSIYADRFVLTLINNRVITYKDFRQEEDGAVLLNDEPRKLLLQKWQERKKDVITHPFLGEKITWGLLPYVQALLLARFIRGDLDGYPAFMWK